jgi:AcrR family transcriptional regulator
MFAAKLNDVLGTVEDAPSDGDGDRRRRLPEAVRRASILRAAREVFIGAGLNGARTKDIAQRAGITEAFMFRLVRSKEDLYRESVEEPAIRAWELLAAEIDVVAAGDLHGDALLERVNGLILVAMLAVAPLLGVVLFSDLGRGMQFTQAVAAGRTAPFRRIQRVVSDAGWRSPSVPPTIVMKSVMGVHLGLALDTILREREVEPDELARRLTTMIVLGVRDDEPGGLRRRSS